MGASSGGATSVGGGRLTARAAPGSTLRFGGWGENDSGIIGKRSIFVPLLAALWLSCVVALDLCEVDEFTPISVSDAQTELRQMEQVMETRFRHVPGRDAFEAASGAISNFNASCQAKGRSFEDWRTKLDDELRSIRRQEDELKTMDAGLKAGAQRRGDRPALEAYNARIRQRKQLVEKLNARNTAYKAAVESYNGAIQKFNSEVGEPTREVGGRGEGRRRPCE